MIKQETLKPGDGIDQLTDRIIGAAIRVHSELGPGFLESVYEQALAIEFTQSGLHFERQKPIAILYHEHHVGEHRLDFLVEKAVVVELKAVTAFENIHFAVTRSYLRAASVEIGLLLNFAATKLAVKRIGTHFTGAQPQLQIHL